MPNHPNIKGRTGIPPSSPTPEQVKELRNAAGLTLDEAAVLVHVTLRGWQRWETPSNSITARTMPAATWELFLIKLRHQKIALPRNFEKYLESTLP